MRHDWDRPHHPVHIPGVNSVETRVRLLEQRAVYEDREKTRLQDNIDSLTQLLSDMQEEREGRDRQLMLWVIATLITCLGGLVTIVLKLLFPSVL
jgi:hypothetical protein